MNEDEGFRKVQGRRKRAGRMAAVAPLAFEHDLTKCRNESMNGTSQAVPVDADNVIRNVRRCQEELKTSELYRGLHSTLCRILKRFIEEQCDLKCTSITALVCYGLGNFSTCVIARYQLALFLCLKDDLNVEGSLYDPAFSAEENEMLVTLQCQVISKNEEGKRLVEAPTLFYMPHCAKELYNNLLWANWSPTLSKLMIVGNSFRHMMDSLPFRQFHRNWNYISKVVPLVEEYGVRNCFKFNDIFNDTSIHIFPKTKMTALTSDFWSNNNEPDYYDDS